MFVNIGRKINKSMHLCFGVENVVRTPIKDVIRYILGSCTSQGSAKKKMARSAGVMQVTLLKAGAPFDGSRNLVRVEKAHKGAEGAIGSGHSGRH